MLQFIINILLATSIYIIIGQSFSMIYCSSRFFHIAHAIVITFAAYFSFFFSRQLEIPLLFSIPLTILSTIFVGLICELCLYKPLRKKNASPMILMIASLGLYTILQNCISMFWGDDTKSIRTGEVKIGHGFLGAYITDIQIITIVMSLGLFVCCISFLKYTKLGRNIKAVSSNSELSNIFGINSNKITLWAFGIGSLLVSITGILVAFDTGMRPTMGFNLLLYGVVAMIIGGIGSNWGLLGGALLLATTQHLVAYYIGNQWMDAVAYIILILSLIWKPLGFSGKRLKKVEI